MFQIKNEDNMEGDISVSKPTIIAMPPLRIDNVKNLIESRIEEAHWLASSLSSYCITYKNFWNKLYFETWIVDNIILRGVRKPFCGKLKYIITGSAPLSGYSQTFVQSALPLKIFQMYGVTETFGTCISTD